MYFFFNDKKYIDFIFELIELQDESCVFFEEVKKKIFTSVYETTSDL